MSHFSPEWEVQYSSGNHLSVWPWSDVVSLVKRFKHLMPKPLKILEIGVGAGANIPFLVDFANKFGGGEYYGRDGSITAIEMIRMKFPECSLDLTDFTKIIPWDVDFSIIIDRASLTHNTTSAIKQAISLMRNHLPMGGLFFGFDWFSLKHSGSNFGERIEDEFSIKSETGGYFKGIGVTHISDENHLKDQCRWF